MKVDIKKVLMYLAMGICFAAFSMIAPFLPPKFESKGVSKKMIGAIFAVYPLGGIVASPIVGKIIDRTGPKYFLTRGLLVLGMCLICFGLLDLVENP
jgi:MFS transporter, DHA1 family, tetracycline resistance protein